MGHTNLSYFKTYFRGGKGSKMKVFIFVSWGGVGSESKLKFYGGSNLNFKKILGGGISCQIQMLGPNCDLG